MNKVEISKLGNALASFGILTGIFYGVKNQKNVGTIIFYSLGFGLAGLVVGNSITKFYE